MGSQWSLVGEGEIFICLRSGGAMRSVGQVKEFKLNVSESVKEMKNYQGGGGLAEQVSWIEKVEASFQFLSLSSKNFILALRGGSEALASGTVSNELRTAYAGGLLTLEGVGPLSVSVTVDPVLWTASTAKVVGEIVKPTAGTHFYRCAVAGTSSATEPVAWKTDGTQTADGATLKWDDMGPMLLEPSIEFQTKSVGVFFPDDSVKIAESGTPVKISYSKTAGTLIKSLIRPVDEYRVVFAGTNFARASQPLSVELYRCKFSPAKELSFIGEDFAALTLTASVLKDDTRQGNDIGTFCEIRMVE